MKTPRLTKDLERKPARWMTTAEAAEALMLKPASNGEAGWPAYKGEKICAPSK